MPDNGNSVKECCKFLRLSTNMVEQIGKLDADIQNGILNVLQKEVTYRKNVRKTKCMNTAGFPVRYDRKKFRAQDIDFGENTSFEGLLNLDFLSEGHNVIMYGNTGTGKTMLSILIGMEACNRGIPVKFYRTSSLINILSESKAEGTLAKFKKKLNAAQFLILDEFGYVPYDKLGSQLLFEYLSEIHEVKPIILNTNLEFGEWVHVLQDEKMTTALVSRLVQHADIIVFSGHDNRLAEFKSAINRTSSKA